MTLRRLTGTISLICLTMTAFAQERTAPLLRRPVPERAAKVPAASPEKPAAINLPFFEDFTGYDQYPDAGRWADSQVYVNNTMPIGVISRGVATFDALNQQGRPYDTTDAFSVRYADSLTSRVLDLSGYTPADSIYLSFFYQPHGRGFAPEPQDSLLLFFRNKNFQWRKVWAVAGSTLQPFQQAMVAVADTNYLHSDFAFRFVNIASINTNDDVWNLDYIRIAAGRNLYDTAVNDLAFTTPPANMLNDYTSMPWRQYLAATGVLAASLPDSLRNQSMNGANTAIDFTAFHDGTMLTSWSSSESLAPYAAMSVAPPAYTPSISAGPYEEVHITHRYTLSDPHQASPQANDTNYHVQRFSNYLAYDDGSAEKSYYLNLFPTLPGRLALEFYLYQPDTLRGFAIYFGQQVPTAHDKFFSVFVYRELAGVDGGITDDEIYTEDFFEPYFGDTANGFTYYGLAEPVPIPQGTFFLSTMQPAASGSDSLYFGLDMNRTGGNHLYYNVEGAWESSAVSGAVMIRPIFGVPASAAAAPGKSDWSFSPNPAQGQIQFRGGVRRYQLQDVYGRVLQGGAVPADGRIDVRHLPAGIYLLQAENEAGISTKKIIKN